MARSVVFASPCFQWSEALALALDASSKMAQVMTQNAASPAVAPLAVIRRSCYNILYTAHSFRIE